MVQTVEIDFGWDFNEKFILAGEELAWTGFLIFYVWREGEVLDF